MKNFLITIVILSFVFLTGCKNNKNNPTKSDTNTTIQGNIAGAENSTLIIQKLSPTGITHLDSIQLGINGEFSTNFNSTGSEIIRLLHNKRPIFLITKKNDKIILKSDNQNFSTNYTVEGSESSSLAQLMSKHINQTADSLENLSKFFEEKKEDKTINIKDLYEEINRTAIKLIKEEKEYQIQLIKSNKESLFIYLALYQSIGRNALFNFPEDKTTYEYVLRHLETYHPDNAFTKTLASDLAKMTMQHQQQKSESQIQSISIGKIAPNFELPNPNGKMISLHSLKGKYILLDFWASWCGPCRQENPNLVKDYTKYQNDNFTILQVSLDKTKKAWMNGINTDNLTPWNHVSNLKGWNCNVAKMYGVRSIPASFLINPEGKIIALNLRGEALGNKLKEIFKH